MILKFLEFNLFIFPLGIKIGLLFWEIFFLNKILKKNFLDILMTFFD